MSGLESRLKQGYWRGQRKLQRLRDPFPHLSYARRRGFIFVHIPKTAGTSVLDALDIDFRVHVDWQVLRNFNPELYDRCFKFCFVRNPYDRAVSVYYYLKSGGAGATDEAFSDLINRNYPTFETFVNEYLDAHVIHEHALLRPQYRWVCGFGRECKVDFVGRFENLPEDFSAVAARLGVDAELPRLNTSKRKPYQEYYSATMSARVYQLYRPDFELFEYSRATR